MKPIPKHRLHKLNVLVVLKIRESLVISLPLKELKTKSPNN